MYFSHIRKIQLVSAFLESPTPGLYIWWFMRCVIVEWTNTIPIEAKRIFLEDLSEVDLEIFFQISPQNTRKSRIRSVSRTLMSSCLRAKRPHCFRCGETTHLAACCRLGRAPENLLPKILTTLEVNKESSPHPKTKQGVAV